MSRPRFWREVLLAAGWRRRTAQRGGPSGGGEHGGDYVGQAVAACCGAGERSSHTWFALKHLLDYSAVRNYDGSWMEWGT